MILSDLSSFNKVVSIEVFWGDMDAANHVNNLIYMRWTETARISYFMDVGISTNFSGAEIGPILAFQDCKYIYPMTFPDTAQVGMKTTKILDDRIEMEAAVFSTVHNRLAAISKQIVIPYDYGALKKSPIPANWISGIEDLEKINF